LAKKSITATPWGRVFFPLGGGAAGPRCSFKIRLMLRGVRWLDHPRARFFAALDPRNSAKFRGYILCFLLFPCTDLTTKDLSRISNLSD
jgi:hypothetical protein